MDIRHEEVLDESVASNGLWPEDSLARVPYWVYQDEANYKREMQRLFDLSGFSDLFTILPNRDDALARLRTADGA